MSGARLSSVAAALAVVLGIPTSQWAFSFTPYGRLTWMSGSQTVRGRTVEIDTNVFEMLGQSQSLIPFKAYFEAR